VRGTPPESSFFKFDPQSAIRNSQSENIAVARVSVVNFSSDVFALSPGFPLQS
jgi:hypothetical protein